MSTVSYYCSDTWKDAVVQTADRVLQALSLTDKLDIERNKVDTTGATVRADYRWNRETEEQELRGYIAERQMHVKVDDLDRLGKLVEGAVAAGVNQVSAEALGAKLGNPISILDGSAASPPAVPQLRMATAAMESDSAATYNAGDLTLAATVTVVFELVN